MAADPRYGGSAAIRRPSHKAAHIAGYVRTAAVRHRTLARHAGGRPRAAAPPPAFSPSPPPPRRTHHAPELDASDARASATQPEPKHHAHAPHRPSASATAASPPPRMPAASHQPPARRQPQHPAVGADERRAGVAGLGRGDQLQPGPDLRRVAGLGVDVRRDWPAHGGRQRRRRSAAQHPQRRAVAARPRRVAGGAACTPPTASTATSSRALRARTRARRPGSPGDVTRTCRAPSSACATVRTRPSPTTTPVATSRAAPSPATTRTSAGVRAGRRAGSSSPPPPPQPPATHAPAATSVTALRHLVTPPGTSICPVSRHRVRDPGAAPHALARAPAPRAHRGGAVVERTTSAGSCSARRARRRGPSARSSSSCSASRPISWRGWLIVVSRMWLSAATNVLS